MPPARKVLPFLLYPALGMVAGWASVDGTRRGKASAAQRAEINDLDTRQFPTVGGGRHPAGATTPTDHPEDADGFIRLLKDNQTDADGDGIPDDLFHDWTDQELLAGLDEAVEDLRQPSSDAPTLFFHLLRAYANRDMAAALTWLGRQRQELIMGTIAFPFYRPEHRREVLEFIVGRPELFRYEHSPLDDLANDIITEMAAEGTKELLPLLVKLFEAHPESRALVGVRYPRGFDYAVFLDGLPRIDDAYRAKIMKEWVISPWVSEDPDAAFRWLMEKKDPGPTLELLLPAGEDWLVEKLDALPDSQLQDFLRLNARDLAASGHLEIGPALAATRTPAVRAALRDAFSQAIFFGEHGDLSRGLEALDSLPDAADRLRMLERMEPPAEFHQRTVPLGDGMFISVRAVRPPDESATGLLRDRLLEWGATGARADAIISRINRLSRP